MITIQRARVRWSAAETDDAGLVVERMPQWASYPRTEHTTRLFTLGPGRVGRFRANFRLNGGCCSPRWYYESWEISLGNGPVAPDRFAGSPPARDIDHRAHLYGGTR